MDNYVGNLRVQFNFNPLMLFVRDGVSWLTLDLACNRIQQGAITTDY